MEIREIRAMFPILEETVYGRPLVYLDNAATSQRPISVVRKWEEVTLKYNSNLHRAVHHLSALATEEYESTRDAVAGFIGASDRREIVFTSGATHALNLLAFSLGESLIKEGDEIVISEAEHHSNIVPWQMMAMRKGAVIRKLGFDREGHLDVDELRSILSGGRAKVLCLAHVSNVLGLVNPVAEVCNICREAGCISVIDGAQGIVHCDVDVSAMGCDFYVFSGHKIYAATGTGVLYGRKELLETLPPYMGGGEMIESVSWEGSSFAKSPARFEAGTQNISGIPTLKPALSIAQMFKCQEVEHNIGAIVDYVISALSEDPKIRLFGLPGKGISKAPVFSFTVQGMHHEDLALILDKMGIAVRSGQMCAEPLMDRYCVTGMVRASFAPYNTIQEAEFFVKSLHKAIDMLV